MAFIYRPVHVDTPPMRHDRDDMHRLVWTRQPSCDPIHVAVVGPAPASILPASIEEAKKDDLPTAHVALGPVRGDSRIQLREYQKECVEAIAKAWDRGKRAPLVVLPTGCHAKGQLVLRADGQTVAVEDVNVGDRLMGPDGTPRNVLQLCRGRGDMYRITPVHGKPWIVNGDHVLTLVRTNTNRNPRYPSQDLGGTVVDVSVREWLTWSKWRKHIHKLFRVPVQEFCVPPWTPPLDPYFLGVALGDGCLTESVSEISVSKPDRQIRDACAAQAAVGGERMRVSEDRGRCPAYFFRKSGPTANTLRSFGLIPTYSCERFVPAPYLTASFETRAQVLAGLLDTDAHLAHGGYDFLSSSPQLAHDVAFLARSLGFGVHVAMAEKYSQDGVGGLYTRLFIKGHTDRIPCRIPRKKATARRQKRDPLRTGFIIEPTGERSAYFGFLLDGDHRYLLDDFTVTHNSGKTVVAANVMERAHSEDQRSLFIAHRRELLYQTAEKIQLASSASAPPRVGIVQASKNQLGMDITVASTQTLGGKNGKRLDEVLAAGPYHVVFLDEAHHAASPMYRRIIGRLREHNPETNFVGLTATPGRSDGLALDEIFDDVCYQRTIWDMIDWGYLVPIRAIRPHVTRLDLNQISIDKGGDFNKEQLGKTLNNPPFNEAMVKAWREYGEDRKTLLFAVDIDHAEALAETFRDAGHNAIAVHNRMKTRERDRIIEGFKNGETRILVHCELLVEGSDIPSIESIMFARPTASQGWLIQAVGRGLRLHPSKSDCLVLDPVGNMERHDLVQLASRVGFDPTQPAKRGRGSGGDDDLHDIHFDEEAPPPNVDIDGASEIQLRRARADKYTWRETSLGWVLLIPRIGYYMVAWHGTTKHRATIRFYDQRPGRKDEPARDVITDPIDFDVAFNMVTAEMDRFFAARGNRDLRRMKSGAVIEGFADAEFHSTDEDADEERSRAMVNFVDLDEGLDEDLHVPEAMMLQDAAWRDRPTTPAQRQLLIKLGGKKRSVPETAGEASDLIGILLIERDAKMRLPATPKQIAYLHLNGLPSAKTKGEAARHIWNHRKAQEPS